MHTRWIISVGLLFTSLLGLSEAAAFNRSTVEGQLQPFLIWPKRTLKYKVNLQHLTSLPPDKVMGAIKRALASWSNQNCTDLIFQFDGYDKSDQPTTNWLLSNEAKPDGVNLIVWRNQWPPQSVSDTNFDPRRLAQTSLKYDQVTGVIFDADIDLNGQLFWTSEEGLQNPNQDNAQNTNYDIKNILTHEIGHLLGLEDTDTPEATMAQAALKTETQSVYQGEVKKRSLEQDDIDGLCTLYPFNQKSFNQWESPIVSQGGCQIASGNNGTLTYIFSILMVLILWVRIQARP